ncbi:MAG: DUF952 domain-containing protein [Pseudomonadota bacterium]
MSAPLVYKIVDRTSWGIAQADGIYRGSADDARDGFIHLSTADQAIGTAAKHFAGQADLLLIAFRPDALGPSLKWEPSRGGTLFPHLYGDLDPKLAVAVHDLPLGPDGHLFPDLSETDGL